MKRQYSRLSQKLLIQFILSLFLYLCGIIILFYLFRACCSLVIWYPEDTLYKFLSGLEAGAPFLIVILFIFGEIGIAWHFFNKAFRYLDAVVNAAGTLSDPAPEPIHLQQGLEQAENELNLVREQALRNASAVKEAEQRKNDLVVYLAHDLKTPLTSVIGYLTLLKDEPQISAELRAKYTGIAYDKARRLEELINEFFDITRFNLSTITLEKEIINLSRMLEQTAFEFNPVLEVKKLTWDLKIEQDVRISCDPDKLERVFDNLVRNAVNYCYPDTALSLSLKKEADNISVCIRNRGKTIPKEKLARIFEQFFRLDSSRPTATGGSGLGLAIAKEIVQLHGGTITAESENETISFSVFLPAGDAEHIVNRKEM